MLKKAINTYFPNKKQSLIVTSVFLIGLLAHFLYLGTIPIGLTHDDADVVGSIKTLAESGVDVSGVSFPSLLFFNKTQGNISGLTSYLLSPVFKLINLNLFSIHFTFLLINLLSLLALSFLVFKLTNKYKLSIYVTLIGLLNPWFFAYSRYPTEAPVALLFTLVALLFFSTKGKYSILISSIFFCLSFYSYYGAKVAVTILFPAVITARLLGEGFNKLNIKKYILPFMIFLSSVLTYFLISIYSPSSTLSKRMRGEFIFQNMASFEVQTNEFRKISIDNPFKNLFYNKYFFVLEEVGKKYLGWISPEILFFEGDPFSVYKFSDHGLFYILDTVLFLVGLSYFAINFRKLKKLSVVCLLLLLIAPIGSSISGVGISYFFRSFLLLPALIILIGSGLYYLEIILTKFNLKLIWYLYLLLYLLSFARFLIFYFVRYPVYSQANNYLSERILSSYITREISLNKKLTLYIANTESFKNLNMFYSSSLNPNINLTNDCMAIANTDLKIYDSKLSCKVPNDNYYVINNQKDAGELFRIVNGSLCDYNDLTPYKRNHLLSDYNLEKMTDQDFCNRWIQNGKTD